MSILINGMDMPEQGEYQARLVVYKEGLASLSVTVKNVTTTYDIAEMPKPHGRLIDADRLIVALRNSVYANSFFRAPTLTMSQIEQLIEQQPTIIEAEGKT